jgi:copper chaperone CopZ
MLQKRLGLLGLVGAGVVLGLIALRAPAPSYVAPKHAQPVAVAATLSGEVPAGYGVRSFTVAGICCQGCCPKLHAALSAVEGVREVAVDPLLHEVTAVVRDDVVTARLTQALTFDEYSVEAP